MAAREDMRYILHAILAAVCAMLLLGTTLAAGDAQARSTTYDLDIPAQDLNTALQALALASQHKLLYRSELAEGKRSHTLKGTFTTREALEILLTGSGLTFEITPSTVVLIRAHDADRAEEEDRSGRSGASPLYAFATALGVDAHVRLAQSERQNPASSTPVKVENRSSERLAPELGEIIVTAQKREQRLFDVPMSVSAITGDEIVRRGAATLEDLQFSVPGMSITEFSPGQQRIQMRGISVFGGLPTVGVYLNEMPLNSELVQAGMNVRLLDIDDIEVLVVRKARSMDKGRWEAPSATSRPQPKLTALGGGFETEGASMDSGGVEWSANGVMNVPVVQDQLEYRLAGEYHHFGGWVDETRLGISDANDGEEYTLRATGLWRPSDPFSVSIMLQHQLLDLNDQNLANADGTIDNRITQPIRAPVDLADRPRSTTSDL